MTVRAVDDRVSGMYGGCGAGGGCAVPRVSLKDAHYTGEDQVHIRGACQAWCRVAGLRYVTAPVVLPRAYPTGDRRLKPPIW